MPLIDSGTRGESLAATQQGVHFVDVDPDAISLSSERDGSKSTSALSSVASIFVPAGFPSSVAPEYVEFQLFDTVQALCSYLRGVLCTQAVLSSVGVGSATATAAAATQQWLIRDGAGMLGGLLFAWRSGQGFDSEVKFYRLLADVSNDVALTVDMLLPLLSPHVAEDGVEAEELGRHPGQWLVPSMTGLVAAACASNVLKAICGVAAGSTRAAISAHLARQGNQADVAAKENSQETFVTLLGLVLGWAMAGWAGADGRVAWAMFIALTLIHVWANWRGVRALRLTSLNCNRASIVLEATAGALARGEQASTDSMNANLSSLRDATVLERSGGEKLSDGAIFIGKALMETPQKKPAEEVVANPDSPGSSIAAIESAAPTWHGAHDRTSNRGMDAAGHTEARLAVIRSPAAVCELDAVLPMVRWSAWDLPWRVAAVLAKGWDRVICGGACARLGGRAWENVKHLSATVLYTLGGMCCSPTIGPVGRPNGLNDATRGGDSGCPEEDSSKAGVDAWAAITGGSASELAFGTPSSCLLVYGASGSLLDVGGLKWQRAGFPESALTSDKSSLAAERRASSLQEQGFAVDLLPASEVAWVQIMAKWSQMGFSWQDGLPAAVVELKLIRSVRLVAELIGGWIASFIQAVWLLPAVGLLGLLRFAASMSPAAVRPMINLASTTAGCFVLDPVGTALRWGLLFGFVCLGGSCVGGKDTGGTLLGGGLAVERPVVAVWIKQSPVGGQSDARLRLAAFAAALCLESAWSQQHGRGETPIGSLMGSLMDSEKLGTGEEVGETGDEPGQSANLGDMAAAAGEWLAAAAEQLAGVSRGQDERGSRGTAGSGTGEVALMQDRWDGWAAGRVLLRPTVVLSDGGSPKAADRKKRD